MLIPVNEIQAERVIRESSVLLRYGSVGENLHSNLLKMLIESKENGSV